MKTQYQQMLVFCVEIYGLSLAFYALLTKHNGHLAIDMSP